MKALSIRQPWAWLIAEGHKSIENREWRHEPKLRGRIAIHASKSCTRAEYADAVEFALDIDPGIVVPPLADLPRGGIVATCDLVDCVRESTDPWFMGSLGLALHNVTATEFFEYKGQLGFFDVDLVSAAARPRTQPRRSADMVEPASPTARRRWA